MTAFSGARMAETVHIDANTRREVLLSGAAGLAVLALLGVRPAGAQGNALTHPAPESGQWETALKRIIGDAKPIEGKVSVDLPPSAENGNVIPFGVTVESAMSETDYVKAIHLLATGNPQPGIAVFHFTPQSGLATVSSRLRLARSQDVIVVAELSNGQFLLHRRTIRVTVGGCGG
jgi:sulfur-oxidizing protein SoxY